MRIGTGTSLHVRAGLAAALCAITPAATVHADTQISTDTTQDGGTLLVDPPYLNISHAQNDPTLTLTNGATANWEGATRIGTASGESGHLEILGGSTLTNLGLLDIFVEKGQGSIGYASGSQGAATVSGAGSKWSTEVLFFVGHGGKGELTIENGGNVESPFSYIGFFSFSEGKATVTGAGSTFDSQALYVGYDGDGELIVSDGGSVVSQGSGIGMFAEDGVPRSNGTATVTGAGSTWTVDGPLTVALHGNGALTISDGGSVSSTSARIGSQVSSKGTATVTGAGSTWTNSGHLVVGGAGNNGFLAEGELTIADGGKVFSASAAIGEQDLSRGIVTVTGTGSMWTNDGDLVIGGMSVTHATDSVAALVIEAGGTVSVGGTTRIHGFSSHTLRLDPGGTLQTQHLTRGAGGNFYWTGGTLDVSGDVNFFLGVPDQGTLTGTATIDGGVTNAGVVSPGHSPGILTIIDDYQQTSTGTLLIELGGLLPGTGYDQLVIHRAAALNGTLDVRLIDGFVPDGTETFTILTTSNGLLGYFANAIPTSDNTAFGVTLGSLTFDVVYDYPSGSVLLTNVVPEPATLGLMAAALGLIRRRNRRVAA